MRKLLVVIVILTILVTSQSVPVSAIAYFPSPLKQIRTGTAPENVTCTEGLELIFKPSNGNPACVKPSTAEKLVERGWETRLVDDLCTDKSGNRVDYIVILTDKKSYTKSEKITVTMKNCGDNTNGWPGNDWGFTLESVDGKTKGQYCASGEEIVSIRPNEKVNLIFDLKALCFDSGFPTGEYWIYLSESNPSNKGKFSIFIE